MAKHSFTTTATEEAALNARSIDLQQVFRAAVDNAEADLVRADLAEAESKIRAATGAAKTALRDKLKAL